MNIVSVSGGKDSTAMLLLMIEKKIPIHRIYFADTGLELPETYKFIKRLSKYCEIRLRFPIRIIKDEKDWDYYFYKKMGGKRRPGEIRGFPFVVQKCWYQRDCKERLLNKFTDKSDITFIGFTTDETKRADRLKKKWPVRFPLIEWGISEKDALEFCYSKGYDFGGIYEWMPSKRVSCYKCPKQSSADWAAIKKHKPELFSAPPEDECD